jgi:hypothetical protein
VPEVEAPVVDEYVPAAQDKQAVLPVSEVVVYFPASQAWQLEKPIQAFA